MTLLDKIKAIETQELGRRIENLYTMNHYVMNTRDNENYNINILNIRNSNTKPDSYDDIQILIWKHDGIWYINKYEVSVDPGKHYLLNPMNPNGTAIIPRGQYKKLWKVGLHKGYKALVQNMPITIIRDFDKDEVLDFTLPYAVQYDQIIKNGNIIEYKKASKVICRTEYGLFGLNCHRASKYGTNEVVGLYSAGCTVHKDTKMFEEDFLVTIDNCLKEWNRDSFDVTFILDQELGL